MKDHDLVIEGEAGQVERAARIVDAYNKRVLDGRIPNSQEVKALLHVAAEEPVATLHGAFSPTRTRVLGKKSVSPALPIRSGISMLLETHDAGVSAIGPGAAQAKHTWPWPWLYRRCCRSK